MMRDNACGSHVEFDEEQTSTKNNQMPISPTESNGNMGKKNRARLTFPFGACRVCSDSATGIHYGIATCEGCKGFFKRSILRKEKYRCYFDNACHINVNNRNRCKSCRFRRCLDEGMSVDGVKMGRIPKLVKERALREQREQQMKEEAALMENHDRSDEGQARDSSSSISSDRSIENDDPDVLETPTVKPPVISSRRECEINNSDVNNPETNHLPSESTNPSFVIPASRYLYFLPDDFTIDETIGLTEIETKPLNEELFHHVRTVSAKLRDNNSDVFPRLTPEESKFIEFIRFSCNRVYLRHSRRLKQLELRMEKMVREGLHDTLIDREASPDHFLSTLSKTISSTVHCSVVHIQELPGMTNLDKTTLHTMMLRRAFDWFLLKYKSLLHENGQSYFISVQGFPYTRRWLEFFYGVPMTKDMFEFARQIREFGLNDRELALIGPVQIFCSDSTMTDQETPRMLRACYLYALYDELRQNHGEYAGRLLCSGILKVLDLLTPLRELYEKNAGALLVQVSA